MSTMKYRLIVFEPRFDAVDRLGVNNGVAEVSLNKLFWMCLSNYDATERCLTKHMVIETAT